MTLTAHLITVLLPGVVLDWLLGDPHWMPHPVRWMGRAITWLEGVLRRVFPGTPAGERLAGALLALLIPAAFGGGSWLLLEGLRGLSPCLAWPVEVWFTYQLLAARALQKESMAVCPPLAAGDLAGAREAVSRIVGRDTQRLDEAGVVKAAVETVAENTSDGVVAPLLFLAIGGAPLGFFYKAVNTMDSMLGYVEPPYKNIGLVPARADDVVNYIPARLSALLMLTAGGLMGLDTSAGWRIFRRDRRKHASPNSAQTESVCAGLLGLRLAGDAWYHGVLHKKEYIGDASREITHEDIPRACRLMTVTAVLTLLLSCAAKLLFAL